MVICTFVFIFYFINFYFQDDLLLFGVRTFREFPDKRPIREICHIWSFLAHFDGKLIHTKFKKMESEPNFKKFWKRKFLTLCSH